MHSCSTRRFTILSGVPLPKNSLRESKGNHWILFVIFSLIEASTEQISHPATVVFHLQRLFFTWSKIGTKSINVVSEFLQTFSSKLLDFKCDICKLWYPFKWIFRLILYIGTFKSTFTRRSRSIWVWFPLDSLNCSN